MFSNEKIICIIPARGGSKRVVGKNIRPFNGKPLIAWTIEEAKKSRYIDRVVVTTEDKEILRVSKEYGSEVIIRPAELASDKAGSVEAVLHALDVLKKEHYHPDYLMLLQCTSPLRKVNHIDEAIEKFFACRNEADSLISVAKAGHSPWWMKSLDKSGFLVDFIEYDKDKYKQAQDFPEVYQINGAIYIIGSDMLKVKKSFQTNKTISYIMDEADSIDIDNELDFKLAEYIMKIKETDK